MILHKECRRDDLQDCRVKHSIPNNDDSQSDYSGEAYHIPATAKCKKYEAEWGWYGLMTPEGKILTFPSYSYIKAVGEDLYLCKIMIIAVFY